MKGQALNATVLYFSKLDFRILFREVNTGEARHGGVLFEGTANSKVWLPASRPGQDAVSVMIVILWFA